MLGDHRCFAQHPVRSLAGAEGLSAVSSEPCSKLYWPAALALRQERSLSSMHDTMKHRACASLHRDAHCQQITDVCAEPEQC
jgi:hypothetical protein